MVDVLAIACVAIRFTHTAGMLHSRTLASYGPLRAINASNTYLINIALGITTLATI